MSNNRGGLGCLAPIIGIVLLFAIEGIGALYEKSQYGLIRDARKSEQPDTDSPTP